MNREEFEKKAKELEGTTKQFVLVGEPEKEDGLWIWPAVDAELPDWEWTIREFKGEVILSSF